MKGFGTTPAPGPDIPSGVRRAHREWQWQLAYQGVPTVATYRLENAAGEVRYLKLAEVGLMPSLEDEVRRMRWAADYLPVPRLLQHGSNGRVSWILTRSMPGRPGTDLAWADDPPGLVRILARGLRTFHAAPVERCPFDFRLDAALALVHRRLEHDRIQPDGDFHPEFSHYSAAEAVHELEKTRPSTEEVVVCHGDYCLPNILLDGDEPTGFVDLGELGVADRWWDLAVATWSVTWNLGPGYEDLFLSEYGAAPDAARMRYYRLLYDVVS